MEFPTRLGLLSKIQTEFNHQESSIDFINEMSVLINSVLAVLPFYLCLSACPRKLNVSFGIVSEFELKRR